MRCWLLPAQTRLCTAEALPQTQYVDMWHETGPDNVGGMGSEPGVAVYGYVCQATRQPLGSNSAAQPEAWSPGMAAPNSAAAQPASDVVGPGESEQAPAQQVRQDQQPRALSAPTGQASGPDQQPQSLVGGAAMPRQTAVASRQPGSLPGQTKGLYEQSGASTPPDQLDQQPETGTLAPLPRQTNVVRCEPHRLAALQACEPQQCLLGLTDDVDCAVVAAAWDAQSCQASLEHISTVPALAYVAAGGAQPEQQMLYTLCFCRACGKALVRSLILCIVLQARSNASLCSLGTLGAALQQLW